MKFMTKCILLSMLIGLVVVNTQAQELSKAEKKALKKEAKDLYKNPAKLKILKDAKDKANEELNKNKQEILKLKAAQHDFEQRESVMLSTIDSMSARLKRANDKIKELENRKPVAAANPTTPTGTVAGVVFKVQVGAYKGGNIGTGNGGSDYTNESADGYNKHLLGSFKQYQPAKSFASHLERLGIKGAWVVAFKDGNRISIKEALGGAGSDTPKNEEVNTDGGK
ncbi:MAG TPA: hypothetical protein DCS93_01765 [Microscillaceae bacterium]|nr:hypothetical protein [Microscillaceae bacterium]